MQGQSSSDAADKARGQSHRSLAALCAGIAFIGSVSIGAQPALANCGDRNLEPNEDCDDGGVCIGGPRAGSECSSESECMAGGACFGGLDDLRACTSDDDCRRGTCRRCRPVGGDGCAANCTSETRVRVDVVPGNINPSGDSFVFGTSGAVIFGPILTIPLPFSGSIVFTAGKPVQGVSPVVIKTSDVDLDQIQIGIACGCVRGETRSTCGGTLLESDGRFTDDCTPDSPGAVECPEEKPCAAVHGAGNTAAGFIVCDVRATDVDVSQDCNTPSGAEPFAAVTSTSESSALGAPAEANALLPSTLALNTVVGTCTGTTPDYGPDGQFCTNDDPRSALLAVPILFTTGSVTGTVLNSGDMSGDVLHPPAVSGRPFICGSNGSVDLADGVISGVFTTCSQPTVYDIVAPFSFAFEAPKPSPTPASTATRGSPSPTRTLTPTPLVDCTGDCNGSSSVTVDELITLIAIALSQQVITACVPGDSNEDGEITVDDIVAAVLAALTGCVVRTPDATPTQTWTPTATFPPCDVRTPLPDIACPDETQPCATCSFHTCRLFGRDGRCNCSFSTTCTCDTEGPTPTYTPRCRMVTPTPGPVPTNTEFFPTCCQSSEGCRDPRLGGAVLCNLGAESGFGFPFSCNAASARCE